MDAATAQTHLEAWLAADLAVSTGQSYTLGNRSLTRANTQEIKEQIQYWQGILNQANAQAAGLKNPQFRYLKWT